MSFNKDALLHSLQDERDRYKQAYDILMNYYNYLHHDDRVNIDKKLNKIGL